MTEPDAGSDVRGMKATAVKQPDGDWVLNGTKHFISGASDADFVIVFMASGEDMTPKGPKKRITCFVVDRGTPGFEICLDIMLAIEGIQTISSPLTIAALMTVTCWARSTVDFRL